MKKVFLFFWIFVTVPVFIAGVGAAFYLVIKVSEWHPLAAITLVWAATAALMAWADVPPPRGGKRAP